MECPSCQHENREEARFCEQCATELQRHCQECGHSVSATAKFCEACSHDLSQPVAPSESAPTSEPPPPFPIPEGERRQATVLFSDLSGYTAMNEKLDPEEVEGVMSRIKAEAVKIVESHGGIVSQFVGDEVLALFGIPTAHEDDPRRAVKSAIELHDMVRGISPEVEEKIGHRLSMHTGINTGLIVTSTRDDRDGRVGVTGDTVNTGARLKALAGDDNILISPETRRRVAPFFELEALPPEALKGKDAALTPYRIVGETAVETRFEASQRRGLSRYVGRERELEMLWECFHQAEQGQGQVVSVVGEAGLGKTRLIYEFRTALDLSRVNQVRGRCAATGENLSYLPFVDLFQRWFKILATDSPAQMLDKAKSGALALEPALEEHLPALLHLLSIPGEHSFPPGMAGEAIQRKIQAVLKAFLAAGCKERPLVMVFEDLHWVDDSSEAMLMDYIEALPTQPALLLLSYRPEYRPAWGHYGHLTPLVLKPLAESATGDIVASTLKVDSLPEGLAPVVHASTEGNPFFTEEVALSMEEEGLLKRDNGSAVLTRPVEDISFPDTVQAVVRARIDRLPEAPRDTLRLAAVVGREFTENLVARLSEAEEGVSAQLGQLKSMEMILEKRFEPELEFMFKNAITHQVAYESLLLARRKALHRLVGLGIEELYADRLPEYYEMLAHHFDQGEVWDKAVEYLVKAGMKARKDHALATALAFFDRCKKILEEHQPDVEWKICYDLFHERGLIFMDVAQMQRAVEQIETAVGIAQAEKALEESASALRSLHRTVFLSQGAAAALEILERLEEVESGSDEKKLERVVSRTHVHLLHGNLKEAIASGEAVDDLLRQKHVSSLSVRAKGNLAQRQRWPGNFKGCSDLLSPILSELKETAPANLYLSNLFHYGLALGEGGQYQEAINVMKNGREFAINVGERFATPKVTNSLAWAYHELCLYEKAAHYNSLALDFIEESERLGVTGFLEAEWMTRTNLGENYLMLGQFPQALEFLESVYKVAWNPKYAFAQTRWRPRCLLTFGELMLSQRNTEKAHAYLDQAMKDGWIENFPFKKYQVRAGRLQGNIHAAEGKDKEAESELKKALKLAKELGNPTQHWRTAQALGNLHAKQGKDKQAATQYKAVLKVVQGMAGGLTDPELKEGFLNAEPIREVFAQAEQG